MNDCEQFAKKVSSYTDKEMGGREKQYWDQHLQSCTRCSSLVRQRQHLGEQLRNLPQVIVSPDFNAVLRARLRMEGERRRRPGFLTDPLWDWRVPAFGTVAVLFLAVSLVLFSQIRQNNVNAQKMIVLTPITPSQSEEIQKTKQVDTTSPQKPRMHYVLDQVTIEELLKDRKGVALSSEGLAELERSQSDSLHPQGRRTTPRAQYVNHRTKGIRF